MMITQELNVTVNGQTIGNVSRRQSRVTKWKFAHISQIIFQQRLICLSSAKGHLLEVIINIVFWSGFPVGRTAELFSNSKNRPNGRFSASMPWRLLLSCQDNGSSDGCSTSFSYFFRQHDSRIGQFRHIIGREILLDEFSCQHRQII